MSIAPVTARGRLVVLSGPSGVGKGTVVSAVRALDPGVWLSVSATTRAPRPGETPGATYEFLSRAEFDRLVANDALLEWAEFAGNRYGTPRRPVEERLAHGHPVLLEIDVAGARQVRRRLPDALLVFLEPPAWPVLEARLTRRGTEDEAVRRRRLELAAHELAAASEFDVVVINDSVERAAAELLALIKRGR